MVPSRNEPCPCGSGKKYKRCCGQASSPLATMTAADIRKARHGLLDFAALRRWEDHFERARELMWGPWREFLDDALIQEYRELPSVRAMELGFGLFELPVDGEGESLAGLLVRERTAGLPVGERMALRMLASSRLECLAAEEVRDGAGFLLVRDDGSSILLEEESVGIKPGLQIAARVIDTRPPTLAELETVAFRSRPEGACASPLTERQFPTLARYFDRHLLEQVRTVVSASIRREEGTASFEALFEVPEGGLTDGFPRLPGVEVYPCDSECWLWRARYTHFLQCGVLVAIESNLLVTANTRESMNLLEQRLLAKGFVRNGRSVKGPRQAPGYAHQTVRIPAFLDRGDLSSRVPSALRKRALHFGRIVAEVCGMQAGRACTLSVSCRRRPGNSPCDCYLVAAVDEGGLISWRCPGCGDSGSIHDWEGTAFDLREARVAERLGETLVIRSLTLSDADHARLMRLVHLPAPALRLVLRASQSKEGEQTVTEVTGSLDEFLSLQRAIVIHFARAPKVSRSEVKALACIHSALSVHTEEPPDLSLAAQAAELILLERSRRPPRPRPSTLPASYRLRVQMLEIAPPIVRVLDVPSEATLEDLHEAFVLAFERHDSHLHLFEVGGRRFGVAPGDEFLLLEDERVLSLAAALPAVGDRLVWVYDLGDDWRHEVVLDSISPPQTDAWSLHAAERAAPPEDCGGPPGYDQLLRTIADPEDVQHEEMLEWLGESFDPEFCDKDRISRRLLRM